MAWRMMVPPGLPARSVDGQQPERPARVGPEEPREAKARPSSGLEPGFTGDKRMLHETGQCYPCIAFALKPAGGLV